MKKSTKKGIAIAVIVLVALAAYHKFGKPMMMNQNSKSNSSLPKEFSTKPDASGNSTKFWFDGQKYWKQMGGPNVKAGPVEITKEVFSQQYSN